MPPPPQGLPRPPPPAGLYPDTWLNWPVLIDTEASLHRASEGPLRGLRAGRKLGFPDGPPHHRLSGPVLA